MDRPLIGVTAHPVLVSDGAGGARRHYVTAEPYLKAVQRAGAVPVILPIVDPAILEAQLAPLAGVVITGGGDIDPAAYGDEAHPATDNVVPERDVADLALARHLVAHDIPTLAICRGIQVLNVALGGSLHQHRPDHMQLEHYNGTAHTVRIEPTSRLAAIVGAGEVGVNSLHHQHIAQIGAGVRVVAQAPDGTVEAIEIDGAPRVLGVQWHPEMLRHLDAHLALFRDLAAGATPA